MRKQVKSSTKHVCGECAHCTEVTEPFNLLSLEGKPTLGRCPYWNKSRSVLLTQKACSEHFKMKV